MKNNNSQQVENLFHAALQFEVADRASYLEQSCLGNDALAREVQSLLDALENSNGFMEEPAFDLGLKLMGDNAKQALTGQQIGAYKILRLLGQGGMGEVYLAEDLKLGRKVALKFLAIESVGDHWAKRQLVKEAQAIAMLDHPNICTVYGIEECDDQSFIVMQYIEGKNLAELTREQHFTNDQILSIAQQMVGAVADAHAHGIIHRDIKPKNVMVTPNGQVKVLDFGLAKTIQKKQTAEADSVSHLSQSGILAGTVAYMSPEQLRGEKLDYRCDVFALGTVLFELAYGKNPFVRDSEAETISAILDTTQPKPRNSTEISAPLDRVIRRCLEKDKEQRYQSASDLLLGLQSLQESTDAWSINIPIRAILASALLLILIIAAALSYFRAQPDRTLAVLPFVNQTGDPELDYLSHGLSESVIDRLSETSGLHVLTSTVVSGYKDREETPESVGRELKVDAVVVGKIVREEGNYVLQTRLVNSTDGSQLLFSSYVVKLSEILNVQKDLCAKVIARLSLSGINEKKNTTRELGQTDNPEAYRQYLLGRSYQEKGKVDQAIEAFTQATELDAVYAQAWAGLADSYVMKPTVANGAVPTEEAMHKARAAARKALEINDQLCDAHISMGSVQLKFEWNWAQAEKEFQRAIELDPSRSAAHLAYASLLTNLGRFNEAIAETEKARDLDPFSPAAITSVGRAYYRARDYDRAMAYLTKVLAENPNNMGAFYVRGYVYLQKGMLPEAIETFEKIAATNKWLAAAPLGFAYAKVGRKTDAQRLLTEIEAQSQKKDPTEKRVPAQERAIIYIGLDDKDQAFKWLEQAYQEHFPPLISLTTEPIFDGLRSDPRFADLARRMNLTP